MGWWWPNRTALACLPARVAVIKIPESSFIQTRSLGIWSHRSLREWCAQRPTFAKMPGLPYVWDHATQSPGDLA